MVPQVWESKGKPSQSYAAYEVNIAALLFILFSCTHRAIADRELSLERSVCVLGENEVWGLQGNTASGIVYDCCGEECAGKLSQDPTLWVLQTHQMIQ